MKRALAALFSAALMVFFMTGCTSLRRVESDVSAFYHWSAAPPGPGTTYRFERLPSQQRIGAQQETLETLTRSALAKVGLALEPAVQQGLEVAPESPIQFFLPPLPSQHQSKSGQRH